MTTDRLPTAPDAEQYLCSVPIVFPDAAADVFGSGVSYLDFTDTQRREFFRLAHRQHASGGINPPTLAAELNKTAPFEADKSAAGFILELQIGDQAAATRVHVRKYADIVVRARRKRQLVEFGENVRDMAMNGESPEGILSTIRADIDYFEREAVGSKPPRFQIITAAELDAADYSQRFLVDGVLVAGDFAIIGGPEKSLKTSLLVDMFINIAIGGRFVGAFDVIEPQPTLLFSGESGKPNLQDISRRVAQRYGVALSDIENYSISVDLPQFDCESDLKEFARIVDDHGAKVVGIDPMFLALGDAGNDAGNMFAIGPLLRKFYFMCAEREITPIIAHHTTTMQLGSIPKLSNLAWSGFKQAAGQWILLNRRTEYQPGSGEHELMMVTGGRAGHNLMRAVDIREGTREGFEGRHWQVDVRFMDEAQEIAQRRRADEKAIKADQLRESHKRRIVERMQAMPGHAGTKTSIKDHSGLNGTNFNEAFAELLAAGDLLPTKIPRGNSQSYDGFKLCDDET